MTVVVDASVVVAALVDSGDTGMWSEHQLRRSRLAAPHLMPGEVVNVLRRAELAGDITSDVAARAVADLDRLPVDLFPFSPVADRVWELRRSLTAYDAWSVALAEALGAALITLDTRLAGAPGPRCDFAVPPAR